MIRYRRGCEHMVSGEWQPISTAPRDGTTIETMCCFGVAPWYGVHKYVEGSWQSASDPESGVGEEKLYWRPYKNQSDGMTYVDPTGGAQFDPHYWRQAAAVSIGQAPDFFEDKPSPQAAAKTNGLGARIYAWWLTL